MLQQIKVNMRKQIRSQTKIDNFSKEIGDIKKNQVIILQLRNIIAQIQYSLNFLSSTLAMTKKRVERNYSV